MIDRTAEDSLDVMMFGIIVWIVIVGKLRMKDGGRGWGWGGEQRG